MRGEMGRRRWPLAATVVLLAVVLALVAAGGRERVQWLVADRITVNNASDFLGAVEFDGAVDFDGAVEFDSTADFDGAVDMDSTLDVAGAVDLASTLEVASVITAAGNVTLDNGDLTVEAEETGGNAGAKNQLIGLPRITAVGLLTGTNGTTESTAYIDATPTGEWAEIDSGTAVAITADTTTYRATTNSVKIAYTAAYTVGDGVYGTIAQDDLSGNESIGFYLRSSVATSAGDFKLTLDDTNGTDQSYDVPAVAADTWTWVEIDISACNANCDTVDGIKFTSTLSESLNLGAHNVWLDAMYKWDSTDEEALGQAILQDGVLFVLASPVAAAGLNTSAALVEWTDYIVNYQTGSDVIVWLSDQSANANTAFIAY